MSQKYVVSSRDWPSPQGILLCTALRTGEMRYEPMRS